MHRNDSPLAGITAIDATDWLGEYAGRLLADLGATVFRCSSDPEGLFTTPRSTFMNAGKTITREPATLKERLGDAQVLLTSQGPAELERSGMTPDLLQLRHPALVHVAISPFGLDGPWADRPASDLTLLAAGGLLALAGEPEREPLRAWGEQTSIITGTHATVAALIALNELEESGVGQIVDVSAQEAVAHSLENAVQYVDLESIVRRRRGSGNAEAGTGLFRCADGLVYLVGGLGGKPLAWTQIAEWLIEGDIGGADGLLDPRWMEPDWRRSSAAILTFRGLFEQFTADRTKQQLFDEGQRRGISIAPVSTPDDLLRNPQLVARDYFRPVDVADGTALLPGSPYRFRDADVRPRPSHVLQGVTR